MHLNLGKYIQKKKLDLIESILKEEGFCFFLFFVRKRVVSEDPTLRCYKSIWFPADSLI